MYMLNYFPYVDYSYDGVNIDTKITHLLRRVDISRLISKNDLESYRVEDYETPADVARKIYNDSSLYWVILLANNMLDPYNDWVMDSTTFANYLQKTYPNQTEEQLIATPKCYFLKSSGVVVDPVADPRYNPSINTDVEMLSVFHYEVERNELNRIIFVVKPAVVKTIINQIQELMKDA